jgi:hypothetical protein
MTIDTSDLTEFANDLDNIDGIIRHEARATMTRALNVLEDAIVQRTPVNFGTLRAGTAVEQNSIGLMLRGMVVNPTSYALPVETGRSAGKMPPVDAIKQWVIRKGIANGREADSAAFLIARAIGRRGTKGAKMFEQGFDTALPTIIRLFADLPGNVIRRVGT